MINWSQFDHFLIVVKGYFRNYNRSLNFNDRDYLIGLIFILKRGDIFISKLVRDLLHAKQDMVLKV